MSTVKDDGKKSESAAFGKDQDLEEKIEEVDSGMEEGAPGWYVSYADMITLMWAFFVILFAIGKVEADKYKALQDSLRSAFGADSPSEPTKVEVVNSGLKGKVVVDEVGTMVMREMEKLVAETEMFILKNNLEGKVQVSTDTRGAVVTLSDVMLFTVGESLTTPAGVQILKRIFDLLKQYDYHVKVEGHTDNTPINTAQFPSNWELSASRAANVARMLVDAGFPPNKISVEGFAEYRPKLPNDTQANRATNRRIEIVYQKASIEDHMLDLARAQKASATK